ncbi:hypothetical protein ACLOJK_017226 [Asimina triloba]
MGLKRFFYLPILFLLFIAPSAKSGDAEALLRLKSSIDPSGSLAWRGTDPCQWLGVKECLRGRVTKLVVEYSNLTGSLEEKSLNQLDQLRVLSFKGNSITGAIPNLSGLTNLKSLFLNYNRFAGSFPASISLLHRLKVVVLSDNQITGEIPEPIIRLRRLYILQLQNNRLTGKIPALNQTSLRYFNVSNNSLSGEIPTTPAFVRLNSSSFSNNPSLCGELIRKPCGKDLIPSSPSPIPAQTPTAERRNDRPRKKSKKKLVVFVAVSIAGFLFLLVCLVVLWRVCCRGARGMSRDKEVRPGKAEEEGGGEGPSSGLDGNNAAAKGIFSWDGEGLGSLVFCGGAEQMYTLEDLLKASAETLGRGTMGSTYKAVMESGFIVTVKRLKDSTYPRLEEFRRQMDVLGRLRHPNLVPLRAYFQAKEERLLVYDYFPNGSLFSLIQGKIPLPRLELPYTGCIRSGPSLIHWARRAKIMKPDSD